MLNPKVRIFVYVLLGFLVFWDTLLSVLCFFYPDYWFHTFHGAQYVDPQALLKRTGAVWTAFTLLQLIAFIRWEKAAWWLVLIAGVRFTELFSDWVYICMASSMTTFGKFGLFIAPPSNLIFGIFLIWVYKKLMKARDC
jgi:hypothetical protein